MASKKNLTKNTLFLLPIAVILVGLVILIATKGLGMQLRTQSYYDYYQYEYSPTPIPVHGGAVAIPIPNVSSSPTVLPIPTSQVFTDNCTYLQQQLNDLANKQEVQRSRIAVLTNRIKLGVEEVSNLGGFVDIGDIDRDLREDELLSVSYPDEQDKAIAVHDEVELIYKAFNDRTAERKKLEALDRQVDDTLYEFNRRGCNNII